MLYSKATKPRVGIEHVFAHAFFSSMTLPFLYMMFSSKSEWSGRSLGGRGEDGRRLSGLVGGVNVFFEEALGLWCALGEDCDPDPEDPREEETEEGDPKTTFETPMLIEQS